MEFVAKLTVTQLKYRGPLTQLTINIIIFSSVCETGYKFKIRKQEKHLVPTLLKSEGITLSPSPVGEGCQCLVFGAIIGQTAYRKIRVLM